MVGKCGVDRISPSGDQQEGFEQMACMDNIGLGLRGASVKLLAGAAVVVCLASCGHTTYQARPAINVGASASEVKIAAVPGFGQILVDGQGFTLYVFVPDQQSSSTCYNTCATAWPPLILDSGQSVPSAGTGAHAPLLGITHRSDGSLQVTYDHWPLYTWVNDVRPGEATGEGLNNLGGLWYVLGPTGNVIRS